MGVSVAIAIAALAIVAIAGVVAVVAARREQSRNEIQVTRMAEVLSEAAAAPVPPVEADPAAAPSRRRGSAESPSGFDSRTEQQLLDGVAARVAARFKVQQMHYERALQQSTTYFYSSLVVGFIGFALLAAGVALALTGMASAGTVTALGGVVANAAGAMVFNQANRAKQDAQANLVAVARSTEIDEANLLAFVCTGRIADQAVRDTTNAALARKLIGADQ
jgi:TRADD-N domain-containing protein